MWLMIRAWAVQNTAYGNHAVQSAIRFKITRKWIRER